jgi:hypothetical protein
VLKKRNQTVLLLEFRDRRKEKRRWARLEDGKPIDLFTPSGMHYDLTEYGRRTRLKRAGSFVFIHVINLFLWAAMVFPIIQWFRG